MHLFASHPAESPQQPIAPRASDLAFCCRLLEVYRELRLSNSLLAEPPAWTIESYGEDLNILQTPEQLQANPRLQAALSGITSYTPSKWLLEQELSLRESGRPQPINWDKPQEQAALTKALGVVVGEEKLKLDPLPLPPRDPAVDPPPSWSPSDGDVYDAAAREELAGLCFSGGGIRSATFCLGVLQGLASKDKLSRFDYLSTVSGGGYIHQWFASWIRNERGRFEQIQRRLKPLPEVGSAARAPEQITWLRRYSNYLTPSRGILSVDTWTMFAIWFRNTFLNQIVLFSFLILCLLAARSITYFFTFYGHGSYRLNLPHLPLIVFLVLTFSSLLFWRALASQSKPSTPNKPARDSLSNSGAFFFIVLPSFLISVAVALESMGAVRLHDLSGFFLCYSIFIVEMLFALTIGGRSYDTFKLLRSPRFLGKGFFHLGALVSVLSCATLVIGFAAYQYRPTPSPALHREMVVTTYVAPDAELPYDKPVVIQSVRSKRSVSSHPVPPPPIPKPIKSLPEPAQRIINPDPTPAGFVPTTTVLYDDASRMAAFLNRHMYPPAPPPSAKESSAPVALAEAKHPAAVEEAAKPMPPLHQTTPQGVYAVLAPIVFFAFLFLAMRLQLGLLGRFYTEERREWLARLGGWSAIVSVLWMALSGISIFGPLLFYWIFDSSATKRFSGIAVTLVLHAVTLLSGASGKSDGKPKPNTYFGYSVIDLLGMIGAPLCILTLFVIASGLIDMVSDKAYHFHNLDNNNLFFALIAAVFFVFVIFSWRVDVNEFSLHGFYRNRLARCYLGATNPGRSPDPFTGFDEHTEATMQSGMRLSELRPKRFGGKGFLQGETPEDRLPYDGPFPIFCSTLNLTFGGDLAWQDRKGASFAFTPLYSGYHVGWTGALGVDHNTTFNGYVPTADYAYPGEGIHLATVAAISGAALSPNMGFNSQPAVAFLMTLFNVRLGWWLANPRRPKIWPSTSKSPTPIFGIFYLLCELFGLSDDTTNYVCLSDGGHFENMGLYELVRRRCKLLVICDAESDTGTNFEGMGLAISKCRTDFGAEITLDLTPLIPSSDGQAKQHFCVGTIQYPTPPGSKLPTSAYLGKVVYLKTSITGDETADILHYRRTFPNFPQDSTLNQWFTETQFESYRRLGQLIAEEVNQFL